MTTKNQGWTPPTTLEDVIEQMRKAHGDGIPATELSARLALPAGHTSPPRSPLLPIPRGASKLSYTSLVDTSGSFRGLSLRVPLPCGWRGNRRRTAGGHCTVARGFGLEDNGPCSRLNGCAPSNT